MIYTTKRILVKFDNTPSNTIRYINIISVMVNFPDFLNAEINQYVNAKR
jgi:hypothetical protein